MSGLLINFIFKKVLIITPIPKEMAGTLDKLSPYNPPLTVLLSAMKIIGIVDN